MIHCGVWLPFPYTMLVWVANYRFDVASNLASLSALLFISPQWKEKVVATFKSCCFYSNDSTCLAHCYVSFPAELTLKLNFTHLLDSPVSMGALWRYLIHITILGFHQRIDMN